MASTFPTSRSDQSLRNGFREIQFKKATLTALEEALKKRINELKELCLKEGEITGQIPIDYPLHPREPLPQIRRRVSPTSSIISNNMNYYNNNNHLNHLHLKQTSNPSSRSSPTNGSISSNGYGHQYVQQAVVPQPQSEGFIERCDNNRLTNQLEYLTQNGIKSNDESDKLYQPPSDHSQFNPPQPIARLKKNYNNQLIAQQQHQAINNHHHNNQQKDIHNKPRNINDQLKSINLNGVSREFLPFKEESKPFQMSDFYKYSSKHRAQKLPESCKTTKQLQEDVLKKASLKFSPCDEKIMASVKLIEESGQKVMEATAKAIAGNPELAEKLHAIMPGVRMASSDSDMQAYDINRRL